MKPMVTWGSPILRNCHILLSQRRCHCLYNRWFHVPKLVVRRLSVLNKGWHVWAKPVTSATVCSNPAKCWETLVFDTFGKSWTVLEFSILQQTAHAMHQRNLQNWVPSVPLRCGMDFPSTACVLAGWVLRFWSPHRHGLLMEKWKLGMCQNQLIYPLVI